MDFNSLYSKMSQDNIRSYKLEAITPNTGVVGIATVFSEQVRLPENNRFMVYGITTISEYYVNIPTGLLTELRNGWVSVTDIYNEAESTTNIITSDGLVIPSYTSHMRILSTGLLILAIRVSPTTSTRVYLRSYTNRFLLLDQHTVTRTSLRYGSFDQLASVEPTDTTTLIVNGYLRPIKPLEYKVGDTIELINDRHVTRWSMICLRKCGSTTINNDIHSIVKLNNSDNIVNHNDLEVYLCCGKANDCSDGCSPTADDFGILVMDLNNDFITLTHQYVAISNVALKKAHAQLRKHENYDNGDVYLRWTNKESPDVLMINKHHMRMLGDLNTVQAMRTLADDRDVFPPWKAQTLAASALSGWLDGKITDIQSIISELGHIGMCSQSGNSLHYGSAVISSMWEQYVQIKYDPLYVEGYQADTERVVDHPRHEIVPGTVISNSNTLGYEPYAAQYVTSEHRVYVHENNIMVDITDEANKIEIAGGSITRINSFPSPLHIRALTALTLYSVDFDTDEYINDNVVLEHGEVLNGHVTLWVNGKALINGLDYHVNLDNGDIYVYSRYHDINLPVQEITVLIKPTINGTTAMSHVGIYKDGKYDLPRFDHSQGEIIITANGQRNTRNGGSPADGTFYGAEYPALHFIEHTAMDLLKAQHEADHAIDKYMIPRHHEGKHILVSPFMNRVLHIAKGASDGVLRLVRTYGEIHSYLEDYVYVLSTEPKVVFSQHLNKHIVLLAHPAENMTLRSTQYDFIKRISEHYNIALNMDNFSIQPNT